MSGEEITKDWIELAPGVRRKTAAVGDKMMQVVVWLAKGAKVAEHAHVHEQITSILSGNMRFIIAGKVQDISEGSIVLKSNVPHAVEALEESWVLDTFAPLREDLLKIDAEHRK